MIISSQFRSFAQQLVSAINAPAPSSLRVVVTQSENYTLPQQATGLRVRSGAAWISYQREDIILRAGQKMSFEPDQWPAVTSIGRKPVVIDLFF
jgi:hypothetical protein